MNIISRLAGLVQWLRACQNITVPAWQTHLDTMPQRQLADLVIPPEKLETDTDPYADGASDQLAKRPADAP